MFCCTDSRGNHCGSVRSQNNNNNISFWVGTSKNKNTDHRVKEICAIMSAQVRYETDHTYLFRDSTMSSALNFCFLMYFIII